MKRYKNRIVNPYPADPPIYGTQDGWCVSTPILFGFYTRTFVKSGGDVFSKYNNYRYDLKYKAVPAEVYWIRNNIWRWKTR